PEYRRLFGGFFGDTKFLPYAVDGFFSNGGKRAFISRIVDKEAALSAQADLGSVLVTAVGEGLWGNRVAFRVKPASTETGGFRLQVHYWTAANLPGTPVDPLPSTAAEVEATRAQLRQQPPPQQSEDFDDLVLDEASPNFVEKRVANGLSMLIELRRVPGNDTPPAAGALTFLAGGADGADVDLDDYKGRVNPNPLTGQKRSGLAALDEPPFEDVAILYSPNAFDEPGLVEELMTHCENDKYRFLILDSPRGQAQIATIDPRSGQPAGARPSQYAAFYYPWIRVFDADSGARKLVPPGGHVAGIYARTDVERGVFKAPANEVVRGALELEFEVTDGAQGILNPRGVNAIRAFPGRGRRVWGARTLSDNTLWKYVNVRRLFIFIEASVFRGTQWVVFEPNDQRLWGRVRQTITEFLRTQWRSGALFGATEEEAFFVRVDRTTMTDDDINNGRLIVVIGIAPVRPAEFVIFRIAQLTSSATSVQL
ncbi:MAG TPA: phage tail sheath C-terminal domain-containing protein, partial [Vicinamibacterales bacterium]|nr:phage tail sheath C-terminal domain-containing protein [Vicinamibacterales bacterium]